MTIGLAEHEQRLQRFMQQVPGLLRRRAATQPLADQIERSFTEASAQEFVLAVVGKEKAGKSTLINALLRSDIAAVGFNSVTACPIEIGAGSGESLGRMRVIWKPGPDGQRPEPTDIPIEAMAEFVADGGRVGQAERLLVQDGAPLLQRVRLMDVPGTGGVKTSNEEAATHFAASGEADAVIHVLSGSSLRGSELEALDSFFNAARAWGSRSYNSLAVVQMWDSFGESAQTDPLDDDPFARIQARMPIYRRDLGNRVAEVLPVSGLLALYAARANRDDLERLCGLARKGDRLLINDMLESQRTFQETETNLLSVPERTMLIDGARRAIGGRWSPSTAGWPAIRIALWLAVTRSPANGGELAAELQQASGLQTLHDLLDRYFFPFAQTIKHGKLLAEAVSHCSSAAGRLTQDVEERKRLAAEAASTTRWLRQQSMRDPQAKRAVSFIERAGEQMTREHESDMQEARVLDRITLDLRDSYEQVAEDVSCLQLLDANRNAVPRELSSELARLFGSNPSEGLTGRLGCPANADAGTIRQVGHAALERWRPMQFSTNTVLRDLAGVAARRVENVLDSLAAEHRR